MNGKSKLVSRIMIRLIPSKPNEKLIPMKLIQLNVKVVVSEDEIKAKVISRFAMEEASARGRITAAFRNGSRNRPVSIGIKSIISSIMGSDCQNKDDK